MNKKIEILFDPQYRCDLFEDITKLLDNNWDFLSPKDIEFFKESVCKEDNI